MKDFATPDATLNAVNVDDLGRMLMALAQEVWIVRDRMAITEKLLEEKAGIGSAAIDAYVLDSAAKAEIALIREGFTAKILGAPIAGRERSVDDILQRAGFAARAAPV